jgi:hypothetical protein
MNMRQTIRKIGTLAAVLAAMVFGAEVAAACEDGDCNEQVYECPRGMTEAALVLATKAEYKTGETKLISSTSVIHVLNFSEDECEITVIFRDEISLGACMISETHEPFGMRTYTTRPVKNDIWNTDTEPATHCKPPLNDHEGYALVCVEVDHDCEKGIMVEGGVIWIDVLGTPDGAAPTKVFNLSDERDKHQQGD